jgi:hypothetical protein
MRAGAFALALVAALPAVACAAGARRVAKRNMGPAMHALETARARWKPDACWSGMYYTQRESDLTDQADWMLAKSNKSLKIPKRKGYVEQYTYIFSSDQTSIGYRVADGDSLAPMMCYPEDDRTENETVARSEGFQQCLQDVRVDLSQALSIAQDRGLVSDGDLTAVLASLPTGYFGSDACRVTLGGADSRKRPCADAGWDVARTRRATEKPVWIIAGARKTALLDARGGRFYFLGKGAFELDSEPLPLHVGASCAVLTH